MKKVQFSAFFLALGLAVMSALAFTPKPVKAVKTPVTYYYTGENTLPEMKLPGNWSDVGEGCGSTGDYPCTIDFEGTRTEFDALVENFSSIGDALAVAHDKRD